MVTHINTIVTADKKTLIQFILSVIRLNENCLDIMAIKHEQIQNNNNSDIIKLKKPPISLNSFQIHSEE